MTPVHQSGYNGTLFEDVAVNPGVLLAVNYNRYIPGPHVINELAVLFLGVVELGEGVALPVRSNAESSSGVLTTDHVDTADEAVVVDTIHALSTEDVLTRGLETSLQTT